MIRIAITAEAFEAIAATMPLCSVGYAREALRRFIDEHPFPRARPAALRPSPSSNQRS
jgi:hypothetical protein